MVFRDLQYGAITHHLEIKIKEKSEKGNSPLPRPIHMGRGFPCSHR